MPSAILKMSPAPVQDNQSEVEEHCRRIMELFREVYAIDRAYAQRLVASLVTQRTQYAYIGLSNANVAHLYPRE